MTVVGATFRMSCDHNPYLGRVYLPRRNNKNRTYPGRKRGMRGLALKGGSSGTLIALFQACSTPVSNGLESYRAISYNEKQDVIFWIKTSCIPMWGL